MFDTEKVHVNVVGLLSLRQTQRLVSASFKLIHIWNERGLVRSGIGTSVKALLKEQLLNELENDKKLQ